MEEEEGKMHITFLCGSLQESTTDTKLWRKCNIQVNFKETWPQDKALRIVLVGVFSR